MRLVPSGAARPAGRDRTGGAPQRDGTTFRGDLPRPPAEALVADPPHDHDDGPDCAHALIYRKVHEVADTGAIPIVLGGDHSITWPAATAVAEVRRPGSIGIVHFDAHADTANDTFGVLASHGTPMRRLIESGAVK